ncbi:MAG: type II secretion system F family protein, partial [Bdellovibrionaceae bacterium]|nr:type II secretion system F family protein [Pseudobdellovibrionaceae bacterium]
MAKFQFEAKGANGKGFRGEIEAANEAEARIKLRAQRLIPLRIVSKEKKVSAVKKVGLAKVKAKDLQIFTRQLATLLGSGIPIIQSLDVLAKGARAPGLAAALMDVVAQVNKGKRLAEAFAEHPRVFDRFYVNMVRAGEEAGGLDLVLNRLAVYIEKSVKIAGKVKGALLYPAIIMLVAGGVVSAILIFVIPKFQDLFKNSGQELPGLTQLVISASDFFVSYWYVIIGAVVGAVMMLINYYRTDVGRATCDAVMIDIPVLGDLVQKGAVARFTRTLATLLGSGVGIMEAIEISSKVVGNHVVEMALLRARDSISEGKSITVPLAKEKYIPSMVTQMIGVGEQTGNLDQMLNKIADFYEDEVDAAVGAMTSII